MPVVRFLRRLVLDIELPVTQTVRGYDPWYGVEAGQAVSVGHIDSESHRLYFSELWYDRGGDSPCERMGSAYVSPDHYAVVPDAGVGEVTPLQYLGDCPAGPGLAAPVRCLFRYSGEGGFWAGIIARPEDRLLRAVYADWLEDRDDPDAGLFRADRPFASQDWSRQDSKPVGWGEGVETYLPCAEQWPLPDPWPNLKAVLRDGMWGGHSHLVSADGLPLPHYVRYMLWASAVRRRHPELLLG